MSAKKLIFSLIIWITNSIICMDKPSHILRYHDLIQSPLSSDIKAVIDKQILDSNVKSNAQWWYCDKKIPVKKSVGCIKFSKDGKFLALNANKGVDVLDATQEYKSVATYKSSYYQYCRRISFDPGSKFLFVERDFDGTRIYSLYDKNKKEIDCKEDSSMMKRFNRDGTIIFKVYTDGLWMRKREQKSKRILKYENNRPVIFDFDLKGNFLAISFWNGEIYIIDALTYKVLFHKDYNYMRLSSFCFSPCGNFLAILVGGKFTCLPKVGYRWRVHIVEVKTGHVKKLWEHLDWSSYAVEYSPCGKFLVISISSGLEFIDSITGKILSYIAYKEGPFFSFDACGNLAVSGGNSSVSLFKYAELTSEQRYFKKLFGAWLCVEKPNKLIKRCYPLFTSMAIRCGIPHTVLNQIWQTFPFKVQQGILRTMLDRIQFYGK